MREHDFIITDETIVKWFLSDHTSVVCPLNTKNPEHKVKEVSYRTLKFIDFDALRSDLSCSESFLKITEYLFVNSLHLKLQSAYMKHQSTESALLKVINN